MPSHEFRQFKILFLVEPVKIEPSSVYEGKPQAPKAGLPGSTNLEGWLLPSAAAVHSSNTGGVMPVVVLKAMLVPSGLQFRYETGIELLFNLG